MLLWASRSIHTLSQHAYVVNLPEKPEINWGVHSQMTLLHMRIEAFPSCLAVYAVLDCNLPC